MQMSIKLGLGMQTSLKTELVMQIAILIDAEGAVSFSDARCKLESLSCHFSHRSS